MTPVSCCLASEGLRLFQPLFVHCTPDSQRYVHNRHPLLGVSGQRDCHSFRLRSGARDKIESSSRGLLVAFSSEPELMRYLAGVGQSTLSEGVQGSVVSRLSEKLVEME